MTYDVSIGIPTYNGFTRVDQLLENIRQRTESDIKYQIIVLDDSGRKEHQEKVQSICNKYGAKFLYHSNNFGVPTGWNTLVKASQSENIVLLNDDILVGNRWLNPVLHALRENPRIGSFGLHCYFITASDVEPLLMGPEAKVLPLNVRYENGTLILHERFTSMPSNIGSTPGRTMCPTGCSFAFRKNIWKQVGGFDERYFCFYEETDFGVACAELGYPSVQLIYPENYHIWSQTFKTASEINANKVITESKYRFLQKWRARLPIEMNDAPDIHPFLMDKIPPIEIRWLDHNELQRVSYI